METNSIVLPEAATISGETPARPTEVPIFGTFKLIAETAVVFSSLAYLAGWSCLFSYYNAFGIGLFGLQIPLSVASIFALRVLLRSPWPLVTVVVGIVLYMAVVRRWRGRFARSGLMAAVFLVVFGLVAAFSGVEVGQRSATEDMITETSQLPLVAFVTPLKLNYPAPSCLESNTLDCRLLVYNGQRYYFFESIDAEAARRWTTRPGVEVHSVAEKDISIVRVQRGVN